MSFAATDQRDDQLDVADGRMTGPRRYTAPAGARVRRLGSRLRPGPVVAVALVLAGLQLIIRSRWGLSGWWSNDDFTYVRITLTHDLGPDLLFRTYNDHIQPGTWLTTWVISHLAPWDWRLAIAAAALYQAAADLAVLALLRRLFGARPAILGPYALFLFSALTTSSFVWYAAAIQWMPLTACLAGALYFFIGHLATRRTRDLVGTAVMVAVGLFYIEKAILILPLLGLFAALYGVDGPWWWRPVRAARRYAAAFAVFVAIGASYVALWASVVQTSWKRSATPWEAAEIYFNTIFTTFLPQLWGGPWKWADAIGNPMVANAPNNTNAWGAPPELGTWLAWEITAVLVVLSVWLLPRAGRAWVLLGAYLSADAALVAAARIWPFGTRTALDNRYVAETAALAAVVLCLAFLPNTLDRTPPPPPRDERRAAALRWFGRHRTATAAVMVVVVNVVALSGLHSASGYVDGWRSPQSKRYFDTLRGELRAADKPVAMFDGTVPANIVAPIIWPANTLDWLLTGIPERPDIVKSTEKPMVPDSDGHLLPGDVSGVRSRPGPLKGCGWLVQEVGADIPLDEPRFSWVWIVRINYLAEADTTATVGMGSKGQDVQLRRGAHSLYVELNGGEGASVRLEGLAPGVAVCVDHVVVGTLQPRARG
jgi:hypothetical protein